MVQVKIQGKMIRAGAAELSSIAAFANASGPLANTSLHFWRDLYNTLSSSLMHTCAVPLQRGLLRK